MKASSAIPFACHGDTLYYDGALANPISIEKAFLMGCDKVVVLLALPEDTLRTPDRDMKLAARIRKRNSKFPRQILPECRCLFCMTGS